MEKLLVFAQTEVNRTRSVDRGARSSVLTQELLAVSSIQSHTAGLAANRRTLGIDDAESRGRKDGR